MDTKKRGKRTRIATIVVAAMLVAAMGVTGIMAYLMDTTDWVNNSIDLGSIAVGEEFSLTETTGEDYTVIPGVDITKDPVVAVDATSETVDQYVFLRVSIGDSWSWDANHYGLSADVGDVENALTASVNTQWMYLGPDGDAQDMVFYTVVEAGSDFSMHALLNDVIHVSDEITEADVEASAGSMLYDMNFISYTIQEAGFDSVEAAYREVRGENPPK